MNEMSKIVRTVTDIVYPLIIIFGLYVIIHGHLTPGGGFQGGAVVASAIALLLITYGRRRIREWIKEKHLSILESIGALTFIGLALLGIGTTFFYNVLWHEKSPLFGADATKEGNLNTGGVIPLMNLSVGLKVIAGLGAIVLIMAFWLTRSYATSDKEGEK